ncbi:MAG TPA: acyl-CoA thioesterase [Smithella sp.]|nr:acyl-CoA thioesterase [Smithella sp.]MDM7987107.1 acyl-CoA thioesterase [Smithella sp.]HNY50564.1 acyl-CoA thioesterase [Smithella sp.]HOG90286.1 acyl-CoA thioesterase [Smithella sp.]HOU51033.1 acyl-CoA thioesterase [Smithella sp.]
MEGKKVSDSKVLMAQVMNPECANPAGNVHGGNIMKLIDTVGWVAATRHASKHTVTASIDRLDFLSPVYVGDFLNLKASVNYVGKKSMEVGVRVEAEDPITGKIRHTASAYLTFVALDENHKPTELCPLILETDEEIRRHAEAEQRKQIRMAEKKKEQSVC